MSFAKAKIQRFNDIKDCSPSPAKYNIPVQSKLKYGIMPHSERCITKKSGSSLHSEHGSVQSTPCFQTPTVPKKKKFFGLSSSSSKVKPATTVPRSADFEELKEKIVECNNKDATIKELSEQIEDMKIKICTLEKAKMQLEEDKDRFVEDIEYLEKKMCTLQSEKSALEKDKEAALNEIEKHNAILNSLNEKHQKEVEIFQNSVAKIRQIYEDIKNENIAELTKLLSQFNTLSVVNRKIIEEYKEENKRIIEEYNEKIANLKQSHYDEINKFKVKLKSLENDLNNNKSMLNDKDEKIKLLEENFKEVNLLAEMQMKEKLNEIEESWKIKLQNQEKESEAILKECQEISEYNIIQSELEKNHFKNLLTEKETCYDQLQIKYDELLAKLSVLQNELDENRESFTFIKKEKHAYEMSINLFKDTIEVLKKRLINSDRDVEQLKEELSDNEKKILDYEKKIADLTSELAQLRINFDELEMQGESTSQVLIQKVKEVENHLLSKVNQLEIKHEQDKKSFEDVFEQLHEQREVTLQAQELIENSNDLIDQLESDCRMLESKNVELELEMKKIKTALDEEIEESSEIRKKYIDKSGKYDELSQQFEQLLQEREALKMKNCELETLLNTLQFDKENKMKSNELFQHNAELESKNHKLSKIIEKLKNENEELRKSAKKVKIASNKENVLSPSGKTVIRIESPGPLREKN